MFPPADDPPDLGVPPNRGPLPVRRNPNSNPHAHSSQPRDLRPQGIRGGRGHRGGGRRGSFCSMRRSLACVVVISAFFIVVMMVMQYKMGKSEQGSSLQEFAGMMLQFGQARSFERLGEREGLDHLRSDIRIGVRKPALALVSFCFEN